MQLQQRPQMPIAAGILQLVVLNVRVVAARQASSSGSQDSLWNYLPQSCCGSAIHRAHDFKVSSMQVVAAGQFTQAASTVTQSQQQPQVPISAFAHTFMRTAFHPSVLHVGGCSKAGPNKQQ